MTNGIFLARIVLQKNSHLIRRGLKNCPKISFTVKNFKFKKNGMDNSISHTKVGQSKRFKVQKY